METDYHLEAGLGRVRLVTDNGEHLHLEFRNGNVVVLRVDEPFTFKVGDVVFTREDGVLEKAPQELWTEPDWVGIVQHVGRKTTVLDRDGHLVAVPTNKHKYAKGNTVQASHESGVIRVITKTPIRPSALGSLSEGIPIDRFKTSPEDLTTETFDDFGGYRDVVARAQELIELPLRRHDELVAIGAPSIKGVLFSGPPGTGKTKLARIIAGSAGAAFYFVNGPEIFAPLVGQSEELLRNIFRDANQQDRAIIFFDEIDSIAAQRGQNSHESSLRLVAQLLTLMDGFKRADNTIVIAATNRPQDIDPALRRPGRFDWEITFANPNLDDRKDILRKTARNISTLEPLPHDLIAVKTSDWSPAELAAIWTEAALFAADEGRSRIVAEDYFAGFRRVSDQRRVSAHLPLRMNR
jgi:transitional endoplasmic reticulum ATPase